MNETMTEEKKDTGKALEFVNNEILQPIAPYGKLEAIKEIARRIGVISKYDLTVMEAVHLGQLTLATQANPFNGELQHWVEEKFIDGQKKRFLTVYWGRPYWVRLSNEWAEDNGTAFDPPEILKVLRTEEKQALGADPKDIVYRVRVRDAKSSDAYVQRITKLIDAGYTKEEISEIIGSPPVLEGIGIVSQKEIQVKGFYKSNSVYPNDERAIKRAYMNALKKVVTFSPPQIGGASMEGYIEHGWSSDNLEERILDAVFVPSGEEDERSFEVGSDVPEEYKDLEGEWRKRYEEGKSTVYSKEELSKRSKTSYWEASFLQKAVDEGIDENRYRIAEKLAYSPLILPGKNRSLGKKREEFAIEWLKYFYQLREGSPVGLTMQETADLSSRLAYGLLKTIEDAFDEVRKGSDEDGTGNS